MREAIGDPERGAFARYSSISAERPPQGPSWRQAGPPLDSHQSAMVAVLRVAGRAGGSGQGGSCGLPRERVGDSHVHDTVPSPGSKPDPEPGRQVRARSLRRGGRGGRHHPGLRAADRGLRLGTPVPAAPDNDSGNPGPVDGLAGQPTSARALYQRSVILSPTP